MTPWSTPRNTWPNSWTGQASHFSAAKSCLIKASRSHIPADARACLLSLIPRPRLALITMRPQSRSLRWIVIGPFPLVILDWDITQIEGATLEIWLPTVFTRLEELSRQCRARFGSVGAFIEDKNSGTILLQQARRRGMRAQAINSKLTAMGKDERAINVSGYVHRGNVKYSDYAFNKVSIYKQKSRNHLVEQVESFRIGDKQSDREDDALDTFCYGIAIALGNSEGF